MPEGTYKGRYQIAQSFARVVYDHYGSDKLKRFSGLVTETDRFDSADLTREDVEHPQDVILLGFLADPRTGLVGDFRTQFTSLVERLRCRSLP
jgi:hypothetical protein